MTKESSSSDESAEKRREVRFLALGGLESGRPVLVMRVAAAWELGLAGVRTEMPGVRGWGSYLYDCCCCCCCCGRVLAGEKSSLRSCGAEISGDEPGESSHGCLWVRVAVPGVVVVGLE